MPNPKDNNNNDNESSFTLVVDDDSDPAEIVDDIKDKQPLTHTQERTVKAGQVHPAASSTTQLDDSGELHSKDPHGLTPPPFLAPMVRERTHVNPQVTKNPTTLPTSASSSISKAKDKHKKRKH